MSPAERPVKSVREALDRLTRDMGLDAHRPAVGVHEHWAAAAGEEVAPHARPLRLDGEVLVVEVDDPAWATHVRYLGPAIAEALNEASGAPVVGQIRVVVAPPPGP